MKRNASEHSSRRMLRKQPGQLSGGLEQSMLSTNEWKNVEVDIMLGNHCKVVQGNNLKHHCAR